MKKLTLLTQSMFEELSTIAFSAMFDAEFDERGRFRQRRRKGRYYWHFLYQEGGATKEKYLGAVLDQRITERVQAFEVIRAAFEERRELTRALIATGMIKVDQPMAAVVEALWKYADFHRNGILAGPIAYLAYSGILGVRLPRLKLRPEKAGADACILIWDRAPFADGALGALLRRIDADLDEVPASAPNWARFCNRNGVRIDSWNGNAVGVHSAFANDEDVNRDDEALTGEDIRLLIRQPVSSVLLAKGGIPVRVPSPWDFALHNVIRASRRGALTASDAEIAAASALIEAIGLTERGQELSQAWNHAEQVSDDWHRHLHHGAERLSDESRTILRRLRLISDRSPSEAADLNAQSA